MSNAVTFMKGRAGQCGYFLDGQSGMHGLCCGEATIKGRMFCEAHREITHFAGKAVRDTADLRTRAAAEWAATEIEPDLTELLA